MLTFIDLCAGIGGFSLGLERAGMICKGQVEIDDYCTKILTKHWPDVPKWGDLKTVDPAALPSVDLICGGYPCQPFSLAGQRKGAKDDRHLWPVIRKIVAHARPAWCLFENVAGHVTMGLDGVLADMERLGYACGPLVIPACAVDAAHKRERVWLIAYSQCLRLQKFPCEHEQSAQLPTSTPVTVSSDITAQGIYGLPNCEHIRRGYGIPHRVDRIKALGNAVVPQVVEMIGRAIVAAHYELTFNAL